MLSLFASAINLLIAFIIFTKSIFQILKTSYIFKIFLLFFAIISLSSCDQKEKDERVTKTPTFTDTTTQKTDEKIYTITGVGDIMMGTNYPSSGSLPPNDGVGIFNDVSEYLQNSDVTFGNLEGTLLNKGGTPKKCIDPKHCVAFRMPEHYAGYLKDAGFDLLSIANNHANDMGNEGRESTASTLDEFGIKYAGQLEHPTAIFVKDGIKYGFTAFAPNTNTLPLNDYKFITKTIQDLKKKCDILIVSFHGGAEGGGATHVPFRREIFLQEDRGNVYEFAHTAVDAGADIIFGQGPHVPRAIELYKNKLIMYSLGNFCTYAKFGLGGAAGIAPIMKIYVNKEGNFVKANIISIKQIKRGIPIYDESRAAIKLIRSLTRSDFPGTDLEITEVGEILKK
ncbi:hypothetical protein BH10BAC5_BH10BAC5_04610 [soil metagenome]